MTLEDELHSPLIMLSSDETMLGPWEVGIQEASISVGEGGMRDYGFS